MSDNLGALVGWTSHDLGQRMVLKLECVTKPPPHELDDVNVHMVLLDKSQAVQLAHYLCQAMGQSLPKSPRKGLLARLGLG